VRIIVLPADFYRIGHPARFLTVLPGLSGGNFLPEAITPKKKFAVLFRTFPADLIILVVWLAAVILAIYLPELNETPFRVVFALPVMLFIPGYCVILTLFPKEGDIELTERIVLSVCVSLAIVPLIGLGLNFTPWGIRLDPIVIAITLFTLVMILAAYYQRSRLPVEEQFRMPFPDLAKAIRNEIFPSGNRRDRLLGAALALAILVAILTIFFVTAVPREGEQFTEFFILGENRTTTDYPVEMFAGRNYPMYISIGNHENRKITYTVETWMINSTRDNVTNSYRIQTMDPLDHLSLTLAPNQTTIIPYNLSVNKTGYNRAEFLLFDENVPGFETSNSDRINASYRNLHLWVEVWGRQDL
jgi:uncharacterized membrane protein